MKKIFLASLALGLSLLTPAYAEENPGLECRYTGSWSAKGAKGQFSWYGFWFQGDGGWIFRGNGNEALGKSQIRAGCGDGLCDFSLTYTTGKSKGKSFSYQHKYKGELPNGPKNMAFNGTWGKGESVNNGGNWKATPNCKQKSDIGDLPKILGWDVWG